ncbi:MAG: hypothetical protein ACOC85_03075 [Thermoplasmatota archaeon]
MEHEKCPKCEGEMEKVVGFDGYIWCRNCHITKNIDEEREREEDLYIERVSEVTTRILKLLEEED